MRTKRKPSSATAKQAGQQTIFTAFNIVREKDLTLRFPSCPTWSTLTGN